ncbi:polyprenol monophosphomannose synthase [Anaerolineales bacterium HSG6]|nr:polyprenol monophosphomannose synthase [Anaerolineales bacterium HSG6]MDM8531926.1 polyprenol monophosphomannose synthase [Anaerolineales bacterium HSG25]
MSVIVVIPTYNEANNLPKIAAELFALDVEGLRILVVDDDSPDNTGQVADELVKTYPDRFDVIHRKGKMGLGTAYIEGFQWALNQGAEYVIQMDADFSHSPSYIPMMLERVPDFDVVVGSRYISGGELDERWSWWRRFLSWWANTVWTRPVLGVRTKDATAGFKCWQADALRRIGLERITSNGYVFQVEMAYVSEKLRFRILEIPIYFEDRRIGQSKMTIPVKIEAALRVFEIRWRHHNVKPT